MRHARALRSVALGTATLLALLIIPLGSLQADLTGDGLDDLGAYAVEVTGAARGPWYQIYNGTGTLLASRFLGLDTTGHQFVSTPVYTGELTISHQRISTGAQFLERRGVGGGVLATATISGAAFTKHLIFDLELNGAGARETGVCKTRASDGVTFFQVYARSAATLPSVLGPVTMLGSAYSTLDCLSADMTGNGKMEIIHIFRRNSDSAIGYQVFNSSGTALVTKIASGGAFTYVDAFVGNFITAAGNAGAEIAFGLVRNSDSKGVFSVWNEAGTQKSVKVVVGNAWVNHQWEPISSGASKDYVFVGYVAASDGRAQYQIWDAETPASVAAAAMTGAAFTAVEWVIGNFDAVAANGEEPGLGYIRNSDSFIGFVTRSQSGATTLANVIALNATYVNPQFKGIGAVGPAIDSVWIGAAMVGGRPVIQLYNGLTGANQLSKFIMTADVV